MTRKRLVDIFVVSIFSLAFTGHFICLPVFADSPVDISIIEAVDDGNGGFKPWEDIAGAMLGVTYSVIPRVKNNGSVPVSVTVCFSESATDPSGNTIILPANTFTIDIKEHWTLDSESVVDSSDPASGNCYNYDSEIEAGEMTEPLFSEVILSVELDNRYKNSTFNLHLSAEATGDYAPAPSKPDTGANVASYFDIVSPVLFSAGGIVLFAIFAFVLRRLCRRGGRGTK